MIRSDDNEITITGDFVDVIRFICSDAGKVIDKKVKYDLSALKTGKS